ncbi:imidazole glycerol phosphate synthase subunit HisH [Alicyclobacillaceae bacterium I2511]|nr:imidazole glycerol phosphate synthase subunit HisH [Alicyclobacillaceae bacterium I2511]
MIALLDLGIGNLSSVKSALARAGEDAIVVTDGVAWSRLMMENPAVAGMILPGVGAFGDAMIQLKTSGLLGVVRGAVAENRPLLGICLGMQMLFAYSEEHGNHLGLGMLPGKVVRFTNQQKVPHMGWNDLTLVHPHPLLEGVYKGDFVYFVHSYYVQLAAESPLLMAAAQYGDTLVPAVVAQNRVYGTQFHPEKSGEVGAKILRNFVSISRQWETSRKEISHV